MIIIYQTEDGTKKKVKFLRGEWSGDDPELVRVLNADVSFVVGRVLHYPTPWHQAKAVAVALGGILEAKEPAIPFEEGVEY